MWLSLGISIICVIFVLNQVKRYLDRNYSLFKFGSAATNSSKSPASSQRKKRHTSDESTQTRMSFEKHYRYVFGAILAQSIHIILFL